MQLLACSHARATGCQPTRPAIARRGWAAFRRVGERGRAERPHRRSQKPPTKSSLYHEPLLRSQIVLSSSWV